MLCGILLLLALLHNHFQLITHEVPLDYNETGMLVITGTIAEGENPYSLESQPNRTSVYPVLYNSLVAPLSLVFGNSLVLHRAVAAIFILASCTLCYLVTQRAANSHPDSLAVAAMLYAGLLFYSTPIASPNSLGILLFLATIFVPWRFNFSNRSLCLALFLGILAFYAKQYFVACLGYVALYLFVSKSKKVGVIFGALAFTLFLISIIIVNYTSPYFLDNTIFGMKTAQDFVASKQTLFKQLGEYCLLYMPIFLVLGVLFFDNALTKRAVPRVSDSVGLKNETRHFSGLTDMNAPLLVHKVNYFWFCFACSLAVIVLSIGKNPGNHLTYFFQLLSPFFLMGTIVAAARAGKLKWLSQLLLIAAFYSSYTMLPRDFTVGEKNWQQLRKVMSGADDIFASTIVLADIIEHGGETYLNGHTRYFSLAAGNKPSFFVRKNPEETVAGIWEKHTKRIYAKIKAQEFDLIILDPWLFLPAVEAGAIFKPSSVAQSLLEKHYQRSEVINVSLARRLGGGTYALQIWKPIVASPQAIETSLE